MYINMLAKLHGEREKQWLERMVSILPSLSFFFDEDDGLENTLVKPLKVAPNLSVWPWPKRGERDFKLKMNSIV